MWVRWEFGDCLSGGLKHSGPSSQPTAQADMPYLLNSQSHLTISLQIPTSPTQHHAHRCPHYPPTRPYKTLGLSPISDPFLCPNSVLLSVAHCSCFSRRSPILPNFNWLPVPRTATFEDLSPSVVCCGPKRRWPWFHCPPPHSKENEFQEYYRCCRGQLPKHCTLA